MPHLSLAPLALGTWQAGRWQTAAHWLCRGLRIATGARPPRLTCGATGVSLWAAPGRGKTARRGCLGDGSNRSVRSCLRTFRRALPRRSLGQERTCHAGYEVVKVGSYVGQAKSVRMLCSASRTDGSAVLMASRTACACLGVRWRCVRWYPSGNATPPPFPRVISNGYSCSRIVMSRWIVSQETPNSSARFCIVSRLRRFRSSMIFARRTLGCTAAHLLPICWPQHTRQISQVLRGLKNFL